MLDKLKLIDAGVHVKVVQSVIKIIDLGPSFNI